jgi:hypothetical protein
LRYVKQIIQKKNHRKKSIFEYKVLTYISFGAWVDLVVVVFFFFDKKMRVKVFKFVFMIVVVVVVIYYSFLGLPKEHSLQELLSK